MALNLTDRTLRSMKPKPDGSQREVFDADARGLSARCSTSGRVSFSFTYTSPITKKRLRKTIGTFPAWSLADARLKALTLRQMVEAGRDPIDEAADEARRITVAQLADRYFVAIEKTHRGHREVRRSIERDVLPAIGARAAEDIRRRDIIAILDTIAERGAPVHANRVRNMISAMWSWAMSEDLPGIESNPASNIKSRIDEQPSTRWLSAAEIRAVAPHLNALTAAKRDALWLILLTGQRPGEVAGLRQGEVDLDHDTWIIPAARSKNKRSHTVPLVGEARAIVARLMADARPDELERHDGRLFLVRARGVRPLLVNNLNWSLRSALAAAGVERAKPHDLRRTTLSHLGRLGTDPLIIGHVANHVSTTRNTVTTSVYVRHDYFAEKRAALTKWDAALARSCAARTHWPCATTWWRFGGNMTRPSPRSKRKRRLIVIEVGQNFDLSSIPQSDLDEGLIDVIEIPAAPAEDLNFGSASSPDEECGLVDVVIVGDAPAPGMGFDLAAITRSDAALLERTMRYFGIDPTSPNSREQYSRILTRLERGKRSGPKPDGRLILDMAHAGVTSTDSAPIAAKKLAAYYQRPASVEISHSEDPSAPTATEAAKGWLNSLPQFSHFRRMQLCETLSVVLKHGGRHGSSSQQAHHSASPTDPASQRDGADGPFEDDDLASLPQRRVSEVGQIDQRHRRVGGGGDQRLD